MSFKRGVGINQIMGGQAVNEEFSTENYVIFCNFVPTKPGWAIARPAHQSPTSLNIPSFQDNCNVVYAYEIFLKVKSLQ